jgi:hypothetical protein
VLPDLQLWAEIITPPYQQLAGLSQHDQMENGNMLREVMHENYVSLRSEMVNDAEQALKYRRWTLRHTDLSK